MSNSTGTEGASQNIVDEKAYCELNISDRRNRIVQMVNRDGRVRVADLSHIFGISEVTIRNDLSELEKTDSLERTHGRGRARGNRVEIGAAGFRQHHALAHPLEQRYPDHLLERADLPADRPLGEIQFLRGARETLVARGAFEGHQRTDGGEETAPEHRHSFQILMIS